MSEIGKYRPAKNVQPGWHIRLFDDDGQAMWHEVSSIMATENIFTGRRLFRFICTDGVGSACDRQDEVMCRTTVEVKRADRGDAS